jgi:hypothetical protein
MVHAECGTKALLNAGFDGYRTAETVLAGRLFDSFGPGMLVPADRNFLSFKLWRDAAATKAELLWRISDSFTLPVLERLAEGSYLSRLNPPRKKDGEPITVRIIEYTVTTRDEYGATTSELFCLATTLLDPKTWPIEEFPALYHERRRAETLLDAVKTDLRGGPDVLTRSQSPEGTRQEIWALYCLYQALADLVGDAARHHRVDPDRISFLRARNTARRSVSRIPADFPPHQLRLVRERAFQELGRRVHDRPGRSSPRATTRHTHRYPARGDRPPTRRVEHVITLHRVKPQPAATLKRSAIGSDPGGRGAAVTAARAGVRTAGGVVESVTA